MPHSCVLSLSVASLGCNKDLCNQSQSGRKNREKQKAQGDNRKVRRVHVKVCISGDSLRLVVEGLGDG